MNFRRVFTCVALLVIAQVAIIGCNDDQEKITTGTTAIHDMNITDQTVKNLNNSQPLPVYTYSQERANLIRRHNLWNKSDTLSYVALINFGKVFATYTVKGKVSSTNSLVSNPKQFVQVGRGSGNGWDNLIVDSPDLDGSYGTNPEGIFFFDTSGRYIEWGGGMGSAYMWSSQPFTLTTPPEINVNVK